MADKFRLTLTTAITLIEQFQQAVSSPVGDLTSEELSGKDALPLLSASASALRAQVTKLSLLAITTPFTQSAITSVLTDLNESVLPSIVTAALLVTPAAHTKAFQNEVRSLTKTALKDISSLLKEIQTVADKKNEVKKAKKKENDLSQPEKDAVTIAAGRVWNGCDVLIDVAAKGVVGFVVRRVEEWRDLVRDAIEEIEEWDPDDEDDFFDDLLSDHDEQSALKKEDGSESDDDDDGGGDDEEDMAMLHERKKSTLRMLKPVSQLYPAIVANRLKKPFESLSAIKQLELLMIQLQPISGNVDEVAGALYESDWPKHSQYLRNVKKCAVNAVNVAILPLDGSQHQGGEDRFESWSKTWLNVMDEVSRFACSGGEGST
ncbi:hypothetical protein FE257_002138 [Aspergillus nanangensis]|uniref:Cyclin-D1-binding protein 1-like N-terminal domain-containing protein n=1 Tax=Aspergillus nanangensis TaxID=2582783 RepID=A0AAD4GX01_ASPNN|nr:hypothetical protein FE257_002138 [Aspergillus nanangensis]